MSGTWRNQARCRGVNPEIFHPVNEDEAADAAKAICELCPVREPCLEYAISAREKDGVWGGVTARERRRMIRQRDAPPDAALAAPVCPPSANGRSRGTAGSLLRWISTFRPSSRSSRRPSAARPGTGRAAGARDRRRPTSTPQDLFELFVDAGLTGLCIPEELGGSGAGILGLTIAIEEVAKYSNAAALMLLLTRLPTGPVLIAGTEEQQRRYVTPVATGDAPGRVRPVGAAGRQRRHGHAHPCRPRRRRLGAHRARSAGCRACGRPTGTACSPRRARSTRARTTASRLHRRAFVAGCVRRVASTGRWACKGVDTGELLLDDVRVPAENVVGEIGGFRLAMLGLNAMRPIVAARGIGLAEGALMYAVEYAKERAAFGKTIADFQGIQWKIAELAAEIEAARLLTYRAAWMADRGRVHQGVRSLPLDGEVLRDRARGEGVERGAPDARRGRVHEGPPDSSCTTATRSSSRSSRARTQIQLGLIASGVLDDDLWWD